MKTKPKIIIVVAGGVVQEVITNGDIDIHLLDYDNIKETTELMGYENNYPPSRLTKPKFERLLFKRITEANREIQKNIDWVEAQK